MAIDRTNHSFTTGASRWQRPAASQSARGDEWHLLDHANRCGLGRHAQSIPAWLDLPSPLPSLGESGRVYPDPQLLGRRPAYPWPDRFVRVFHRCYLCAGQKGGAGVGKTKRGKGSKIMVVADSAGTPVAIHVSSASPHESQLVESTLAARFVASEPERLIGDKAYDSDELDATLAQRGIQLIAPHRCNRTKPKTQDGRVLRRYKRRWKIERLNSWLLNHRRIVVRYERTLDNYVGFVHLACVRILLRRYF